MSQLPYERDTYLTYLTPFVKAYETAPPIQAAAGRISLTALVGGAGAGKDTLGRASGLHKVLGITTRSKRDYEIAGTDYRSYIDIAQEDTRFWLDGMLRRGGFVQVEQFPDGGEIYASEIHDFPKLPETNCIMDVTAQWYEDNKDRNLFGDMRRICLIPFSLNALINRLDRRDGKNSPSRSGRLEEWYRSLAICLQDPDTRFLVNDTVPEASERLRLMATGGSLPGNTLSEARQTGFEVLTQLERSGLVDVRPFS